ncbi:MAG: YihY/virulence factor BrkB family protein [Acidimicrobiales bacterium]|nr:YihY/virulence factor BrkB family protein [Acidimicrobiales bacterium]
MASVFGAIKAFPRFVWDVAKVWYHGGIGDLAAGVTFWILITVPAAVLTLVSSASFLDTFVGTSLDEEIRFEVLTFVNETFAEGADTARDAVNSLFQQPQTGVFTIAAGLTLFTISRGFAGMIRALDTVYDIEDGRPWYHTRFVGLILGLGTVLILVPMVLLEVLLWSRFDVPLEGAVSAVLPGLILVGWASLMFHYGPSARSKWRWDLPGAIVAAVFWWGLSEGFNRYVGLINLGGDSESVLAIIGGFLLALTWIWLAAQVLLIGAAVNFVLGERLDLHRGRKPSVFNAALSNATGELKKVVVSSGRSSEGQQEFSPKAVAQRWKPTGRARSVLDVREDRDSDWDPQPADRDGPDPTAEMDLSSPLGGMRD